MRRVPTPVDSKDDSARDIDVPTKDDELDALLLKVRTDEYGDSGNYNTETLKQAIKAYGIEQRAVQITLDFLSIAQDFDIDEGDAIAWREESLAVIRGEKVKPISKQTEDRVLRALIVDALNRPDPLKPLSIDRDGDIFDALYGEYGSVILTNDQLNSLVAFVDEYAAERANLNNNQPTSLNGKETPS